MGIGRKRAQRKQDHREQSKLKKERNESEAQDRE